MKREFSKVKEEQEESTLVTELGGIMKCSVAVVVLNIDGNLSLGDEVANQLSVSPEGGLVEGCATRRRLFKG